MRVPKIPLTDSRFNYVSSAKTDIRDTFRRVRAELSGGQDKNKPLVSHGEKSLKEPLVPILNPEGFVLSEEWFSLLE
jgi:hypothetical protein